jgi:group II intron reverse transcriptase/maturase
VDGIRKETYAQGLDERIADLSARLRRLGYRPKPARRTYIPKGDGRYRPLGIPSFEDRLVQDRLSRILQAIWEPEFRNCSYGFRPGRSAHDALRRVAEVITNEQTQWVVEADIKGFFDHVSHDHLMRFLEHRIADPNFLRIVRRFLKAGIMEDGLFTASDEGEHLSPLRTGSVVREALCPAMSGQGPSHPLRRRLCAMTARRARSSTRLASLEMREGPSEPDYRIWPQTT